MINKLSLLLRSKIGLAVVGGLLVAAVGATGLAVTGASAHLMAARQGPTPAQCASDDQSGGHTRSQSDDRDERDNQGENQHAVQGTITSVDTASSSFIITQCNGTSTTIETSAKTTFDGSDVHGLADLKTELFVDVEGIPQSHGRFTASGVHVETIGSEDVHDGADGDDHQSSGGTTTPGTAPGD